MFQRIIKKQTVTLFLSVLMLGLFIFATYFYWVPDTLISFVPDKILFYTHLSLNKFHYSGYLTRKWLNFNIDKVESIFKEYSINPDIINSLEEIAFFIPEKNSSDISQFELVLKSKIDLNDLQALLPSSCFVNQISNKVFAVSFQVDSNRLEDLTSFSRENRFRFINPFNKKPSLIHGYANLGLMSAYLPIEKRSFESNFIRFNVLYSSSEKSKVFFEIEDKNNFDYSLFVSEQNDFSVLGNAFDFVFVFPKQEPIDELRNRIKIYLASQRPKERKIILPDNSSFIELIVDIEDFVFKKEGLIDYWQEFLSDESYNFEVALFQNQERTFFSNNHILLKEIILTEQKESSNSALYWEINNVWLQRLVLKEENKKIKGYWELK